MSELDWSPPATDEVPTEGAERFFDDLRLLRAGDTAWAWYADFMPVRFPFGDLTALFDESADAAGGTARIIAAPPVAYFLIGEGTLELEDVTTGTYRAQWIDFGTGNLTDPQELMLDGGDESFDAPISGTVGLTLQRIGR